VVSHAVGSDEGLRRRVGAFAHHEGVCLGSVLKPMILDFKTSALRQIQ